MGYFTKSGDYQPTMYDVLIRQKKLESAFYYCDLGYGMILFEHKTQGNRQTYLVNSRTQTVYDVMDMSATFNLFSHDDIDIEHVKTLPGADVALRLCAPYEFHIGHYHQGLAPVSWMIDPAAPTVLEGMIDCEGKMVGKFRPRGYLSSNLNEVSPKRILEPATSRTTPPGGTTMPLTNTGLVAWTTCKR